MNINDYLPRHQPVELPSKGKFYEGTTLEDGWINIREYAAPEENLLSTANPRNIQKIINKILDSCIEDDFPAGELTSSDSFYLLVWLRAHSYGVNYTVEFRCPECQEESPHDIDLRNLHTVELDEDVEVVDPMVIELPKTCLTAEVTVMRRKYEIQAIERAPDLKKHKKVEGNPVEVLKRSYSVKKFIKKSGEEIVNQLDIEEICAKALPAADSLLIDETLNKYHHGIDLESSVMCESCGEISKTTLPLGPEFFRPSRLSLPKEGEPTFGNSNSK